jgi:hypothetical protein
MFDPRIDNLDTFTDSEIENRIIELGRKYWMSRNPEVQQQIAIALDMYKEEASIRRAKALLKQQEQNGENPLDNLINVS